MGEKLFTAKEAAEILKVRKNTVYDMIKRGDLKASKLGKQLRIRQEDLDFYIQYGSQAKVVDSMQTGHNSNIDKAEFEKNTSKLPNVSNEISGVSRTTSATQNRISNQIIICGQDMILDLLANRLCFLISGLMRKRNISVLGAVTMFSTSDSSSLDCFLGHSISDDIKKAKRDVATLLLHLAWLCLQRKFESGGKILNQASYDKGRSRSAHGYRCCQAQIPMR